MALCILERQVMCGLQPDYFQHDCVLVNINERDPSDLHSSIVWLLSFGDISSIPCSKMSVQFTTVRLFSEFGGFAEE